MREENTEKKKAGRENVKFVSVEKCKSDEVIMNPNPLSTVYATKRRRRSNKR